MSYTLMSRAVVAIMCIQGVLKISVVIRSDLFSVLFFTGSHNSQVQLWKCGQNYRALEPLFNVTVVGSQYFLCFLVGNIFEHVFKLRQIIYSYHNNSS